MHSIKIPFFAVALITGFAPLWAQAPLDQIESTERNQFDPAARDASNNDLLAPTIYDGELEDIGPQYLLLQQERRKWFEFFTDLQAYSTTNATLVQDDAEGADILAATAELAVVPFLKKVWGGNLKARIGTRQQIFFYGALSDSNARINGTIADDLDFTNNQTFTDIRFRKGPMSYMIGAHYSELTNRNSSEKFYKEFVPKWSASYDIEINPTAMFTVSYNGNIRFTEVDGFGFVPDNWNDQTEHTISGTFSNLLSDKLLLQTGAGLEYSYYLESGRDRQDTLGFLNLTVAYFFNKHVSARLFTSYELKESSESTAEDYTNLNIGGGASFNLAF